VPQPIGPEADEGVWRQRIVVAIDTRRIDCPACYGKEPKEHDHGNSKEPAHIPPQLDRTGPNSPSILVPDRSHHKKKQCPRRRQVHRSAKPGKVAEVLISAGSTVDAGDLLLRFE
jgi:hypothetical protein